MVWFGLGGGVGAGHLKKKRAREGAAVADVKGWGGVVSKTFPSLTPTNRYGIGTYVIWLAT